MELKFGMNTQYTYRHLWLNAKMAPINLKYFGPPYYTRITFLSRVHVQYTASAAHAHKYSTAKKKG